MTAHHPFQLSHFMNTCTPSIYPDVFMDCKLMYKVCNQSSVVLKCV